MGTAIRQSRALALLILVAFVLLDAPWRSIQLEDPLPGRTSSGRVLSMSSRGGPRATPAPSLGHDLLSARPQFSPATAAHATPAPSPPTARAAGTPAPTREQHQRVAALGVFRVTAYSDSPRNGTDGRGITKSGQRTRWGVVAVDPSIIPLGSKLLIEGMEETVFTALDTGGGVIGNWVDVWFGSDAEALAHGVSSRRLYLLLD